MYSKLDNITIRVYNRKWGCAMEFFQSDANVESATECVVAIGLGLAGVGFVTTIGWLLGLGIVVVLVALSVS